MKSIQTHTSATSSISKLLPQQWQNISINERLQLLYKVRENLAKFADELAKTDANMKNTILGEKLYSHSFSKVATVFPFATAVSGCIDVYKALQKGKMLEPKVISQVADNLYDIEVFPKGLKDRVLYFGRRDILRVKGLPKQVNPYDKETQVVAILGAGNYSSSLEIVKAIFLENAVVVHKPHPLNFETDKIWAKVLQPLRDAKVLSYCQPDDGQALTQDTRLGKIYFTGGAKTAEMISKTTDTPLISECGGNNPCIIVPSIKPWSKREIKHQALQIATIAKLNGGAICGRPQTIITSKHWSQRREFLDAVKNALQNETPAVGTYYPNSRSVRKEFEQNHKDIENLKPENAKYATADFLFMENVSQDDYCIQNEAFCQIMNEVALDIPAKADEFLPKAVEFCNTKLHGTLTSCILADEYTKKTHSDTLARAITNMQYGSVTVNVMSVMTFFNPYLTWGGNASAEKIVSGHGNFGNLLNYENVEKSIIYDKFVSPSHLINTNKANMDKLYECMVDYSIRPNWLNLSKMLIVALVGKFKKKDF